jgi:hypothetical protein
MNLVKGLRFAIWLLGVFLLGLDTASTSAQTSASTPSDPQPEAGASEPGFHIGITPYLWFSGINGTIGVRGHDASVHASASDVLDNLDIGFMILAEPRYNRFVFPVDFLWVKLSDTKGLPFDQGVFSVKANVTDSIVTQKFGYRLVDKERLKADVLFGYRVWILTNNLRLQPISPLGGFSQGDSWVDSVSGANFSIDLGRGAFVRIFGDAGGGAAKLDYQVGGGLGLRVARKWAVEAGYRYLVVHYGSRSNFLYDVAQSGVVIGVTWSPK